MRATGDHCICGKKAFSCLDSLIFVLFALLPTPKKWWKKLVFIRMNKGEVILFFSFPFLSLSFFFFLFFLLPRYILANEPGLALGSSPQGNKTKAGSGAWLWGPQGKAAALKGPMPSSLEETRERALGCTTEITAAPPMPASFINFIAEKPIWPPCSLAR